MRTLLAGLVLLMLAPGAQASEVRNYFTPELDGHRVDACLSDGSCGKAAADAFCKVAGYDEAMLFQRERAATARSLDSDRVCDGDCTAFRQVKCFTARSESEPGKTAL